ncbi:MAG: tRNA uridine(34) 5-carboxymethylaminomethyl modification radical SAM/GNAT enzyme Elp3 [Candidatus Buchananbacteria bacterium]|nr:tRNA uridine(34) 5-carboxymethylaminomethyl modification radical SAM/GNAT enzyme Elp3 [Candidatus Buchananbacteria bacterium]
MTKIQLQKIIKSLIKAVPQSYKELMSTVRREAGNFGFPTPEKSKLLSAYHSLLKNKKIKHNPNLEKLLTKRAVRTMSGVAVITVLTKAYPCPGRCVFCPTEARMPKSYLSNEPAVMRAILNDFDPYRQIKMRLRALKANGHKTDKVELIVIGGTWSSHPHQYQNWYIKRCFEALNGRKAKSLKQAQKTNETAKHRCVGLTLETRPDFITEKEIIRMRNYGCTRVELGIQHIDNKILAYNKRGHTAERSIKALRLLKEAGFKINLHFMLDLPGSSPAKDLAMFKKIYTQSDFMPDMVKVYPCVVNEHAELYNWWKSGRYKPYSEKQLHKLLINIKKITPEYVRITRLIRDIPKESILAGNSITNLRQLLDDESKKEGWSCRCIRCREVSRHNQAAKSIDDLILKVRSYRASCGTEYFLSYESKDEKVIYSFLRLRLDDKARSNFMPELVNAGLVRELHTYGQLTELGQRGKVQHIGLGSKLLKEAENICQKEGLPKMAIIAGVGVRQYYEKFGYKLEGTYMTKKLK